MAAMDADPPQPTATRSVDRALQLLAEVTDSGAVSLAEAARRANVPTSTALRLLRTLESWGFVRRAPDGEFAPGPRLLQLGVSALSADSLTSHAHAHLTDLCATTGESAYLAVPGPDDTALYLDQVATTKAIRHVSWVGRSVPLAGTAIGAALLGQVGDQGFTALRSTLEPDVTAVAAPVRISTGTGEVVAALSVVGPSYRISDVDLAAFGGLVLEHANVLAGEVVGEERQQ
ncbi:IclR family transcriptional regulator [Tamaricihabitans halophyticus]|uniref:IclR family transcriptional regulator n=1 Tax=Tamaricihabitans halophyticus TaxID=1262583 RepID=A0A4R2Q7E3_9PSEU|nr:IclR family transcriptional regulator [Tamaricihabitans halophyticus]TCP42625.1 IclR family transcriptional regulator [Tamaricihabitans halophyticus]